MKAEINSVTLGQKATRGFSWLLGQTLGTKLINMATQVVLAWLLAREDFGLIGLAYTVTAFISVLQQAGLREILIHRHAQFNRWANPVFWMSACLGMGGMLLTWAAIPLATRVYHAPELAGLLLILSFNSVLGSLTVVPQAKLSNELRFGAMSVMTVVMATVQAMTACGLAWLGWGAYAIAVSAVVGMGTLVGMLWSYAPHWPKRKMQVRRWRFMVGDSAAILGTGVLLTVISQGDYMALGIFHTAAVTGLYYFAFNLSMQTITLFTGNLGSVLFPALSKLQNEPKRQTEAFIRAARLLALVAIPACWTQAAIAGPLVRLIFPTKWYAAIPVIQILCFGMAFRAVGSPSGALMQSQGRFKTLLILCSVMAAVYLSVVTTAAGLGGILSMAVVECLFFMILGPVQSYIGILHGGGRWRDIGKIYLPALTGATVAILPGYIVASLLPPMRGEDIIRIGIVVISAMGLFWLVMPRLAPKDWQEMHQRLRDVLYRRRNRKIAAVSI